MKHIRKFKIFESAEEDLFVSLNRNEWYNKRIYRGYDHFTEKEIKEIDDIFKFRDIKCESWKQLYCEYVCKVGDFRKERIIIKINKCQDEWFYVETVDNRFNASERFFEVDSMDGLENLLNAIISLYKNNQSLNIPLRLWSEFKESKIFETLYTPEIRDYIDDIFFEFSDYHNYEVTISTDEMIHTAPNTSSVIFGNNFVYPSDSEKQYGRLPGMGNRNWKLGFLVKISCENPNFEGNPETMRWEIEINRMARRDRVKRKREIESYEKKLNKKIEEVRGFVESKIKTIKRRCPKEIFLHGVKMEGNTIRGRIEFDFAFIYQEFK